MSYQYLFFFVLLVSCRNIEITLWQREDCTGDNDLRPKLDLELHYGCNKRGDVAQQLEVEMLEGLREEKALSAYQDGSMQAQSQSIVFFTSEDCDPSTEIEGAYVDNSCSNVFDELHGDEWQSYEMRDACFGGYSGCDLDDDDGFFSEKEPEPIDQEWLLSDVDEDANPRLIGS